MNGKTVFVLGAGFTKAFVPETPLMEDNYKLASRDYGNLPLVQRILAAEEKRAKRVGCTEEQRGEHTRAADEEGGWHRLNIERLMTRATTVMPHDEDVTPFTAVHELGILLDAVQGCHIKRLRLSPTDECRELLNGFAEYLLRREIDCVSFNYDPLLDAALFLASHPDSTGRPSPRGTPRWHPESGYGFYCPSTEALLFGLAKDVLESAMVLLKLNGSLTWLPRLREPWPYRLGSVAHNDWRLRSLSEISTPLSRRDFLNKHFEMGPYIAPPTMSRSTLVDQPILSLVWRQAYERLQLAQEVVFIGYSFPASDYVARWLFQEGLAEGACITVVNYAQCESVKQGIRASYREMFPDLGDGQFRFDGAVAWVEELLKSG